MKTAAFVFAVLSSIAVSAQAQKPTTGYAPVNGLEMYYEVHGSGDPVVLLHGSFMTITNNWTTDSPSLGGGDGADWIGELAKTRKVIALEMQGHGRTADIDRDFSYENFADDVAALLDHLQISRADLIGYSLGGGVAMQCAIRHPEKVRKAVCISAFFRRDGLVKEAVDAFPQLTAESFKGSPIEIEYKKLSPTPNEFPNFVKRVVAIQLKPYDFGADKLKAAKAPMFFIHGDADGVRLEHIAEMFRLKGGEVHGDLRPRSASRLAILPDTTHVTLMERMPAIVPMVNDFFDTSADEQATKKDLSLLQGEWAMVSGSADGQPMPDQMLKQMRRICKGDETTTTMGGRVFFKAKITIDPSKKPKTIDYEMTEGFTKGQKQLGIYEVEEDTFKSCFGKPGAERPTDFTTKPGEGRTLSVWKREKATTPLGPKSNP